ncbi:hypothetical protein TEA_009218 [Camellia sinensis var. sinensis]|uniref:Uncharacterized protein n=1 Tax=Camellia sinensis var. sinensis TaxID=542762 RepID=A0A4S4EER0_CAMSN|nr:hypothetical protein TEA_009218 [Camellia sinensis var. sinensis]
MKRLKPVNTMHQRSVTVRCAIPTVGFLGLTRGVSSTSKVSRFKLSDTHTQRLTLRLNPLGTVNHRDSLPLDLDSSTGNGPALMLWPKKQLTTLRREVLGGPLSEEEVAAFVEWFRHNDCSQQINLVKVSDVVPYVNFLLGRAFEEVEVVKKEDLDQ